MIKQKRGTMTIPLFLPFLLNKINYVKTSVKAKQFIVTRILF